VIPIGLTTSRTLRLLAVLAIPAALALVALAVDVFRAQRELTNDDARFRVVPMRQVGLWDVSFLPGDAGEALLRLGDDVEYRKLAGLYLKVEPGRVDYQGFPTREAMRAKVQFELTRLSREQGNPTRRSRILTLYSVMTLDGRPVDKREREDMIRRAISAFRAAIELDPSNTDAKTNLEAALSIFPPITLYGNNPSGGANQGPVSGQGTSGTGY
jgi:hypothetical protein